jgi:hypothetical protein
MSSLRLAMLMYIVFMQLSQDFDWRPCVRAISLPEMIRSSPGAVPCPVSELTAIVRVLTSVFLDETQ